MIRLMIKMTFWSTLVLAALPGARQAGVFNNGITPQALAMAMKINAHDLVSACARNAEVCGALATVANAAGDQAKQSLFAAYHGIRNQYDEPDRDTITAGIRK